MPGDNFRTGRLLFRGLRNVKATLPVASVAAFVSPVATLVLSLREIGGAASSQQTDARTDARNPLWAPAPTTQTQTVRCDGMACFRCLRLADECPVNPPLDGVRSQRVTEAAWFMLHTSGGFLRMTFVEYKEANTASSLWVMKLQSEWKSPLTAHDQVKCAVV